MAAEQNNVTALKNLAAKVCGVEVTAVTGETIADVINYIAEHYPQSTGA